MSLPDPEALVRGCHNDIWFQVAVVEVGLEAQLRAIGGEFACGSIRAVLTKGGLHYSEEIGINGVRVEIDVDGTLDEAKNAFSGKVVTLSKVDAEGFDHFEPLKLRGETVVAKMRNVIHLIELDRVANAA